MFQVAILALLQKELIRKVILLNSLRIRLRKCFPINSLFLRHSSIGRRASKQKSGYPSEAMRWIKDVEMVDSVDDLKTSQSIRGHWFPNFEILDVKIASSLKKIIQNSNFKKRVNLPEHDDRFFRRKADRLHDLWMFLGNGRSWGWSWLFWSLSHYLTCRRRSDRYLETIFWKVFTRCAQVGLIISKPYWHFSNKRLSKHNSQPNYQKLKTMVKGWMDQKIRARNFEARYERIESGGQVKARSKGIPVSVGRVQGECHQWKA